MKQVMRTSFRVLWSSR